MTFFSVIGSGIAGAYHYLVYWPLLNILVFFYETIALHDLGVAIILLTLLIRLLLYPVFAKAARHGTVMQRLQPKLKKIQEEYRHDRVKQGQAMMDLYREHRINPFSGFGLLLIQLPVLIALFRLSFGILTPDTLTNLYGFIPRPESIGNTFLGLINLSEKNILIVVTAAVLQFVQAKLAMQKVPKGQELTAAERMSRQMAFMTPAITAILLLRLPSALGLYWITTTAFSIFQQYLVNREMKDDTNHGQPGIVRKKDH